jgi:hypothetical protein
MLNKYKSSDYSNIFQSKNLKYNVMKKLFNSQEFDFG